MINIKKSWADEDESKAPTYLVDTDPTPEKSQVRISLVSRDFHGGMTKALGKAFTGKLHIKGRPRRNLTLCDVWSGMRNGRLLPSWLIARVEIMFIGLPTSTNSTFADFPDRHVQAPETCPP